MVSVVIPNYNGSKYIKQCIESLKKQNYKNYEIIIIDNGSIDNSLDIIESYKDIIIIKNKINLGFSKAVNQGIKKSKGKYIVLLNNDTVVCKGWLYYLVKGISKDKKIFSASSKMIRYYNTNIIDDAGDYYNIFGFAYKYGDSEPIYKYNKDRLIFSSCAGSAIYRKSVFKEMGYFDEKFFSYLEDVDISYRAKIYGYKNVYCSKSKVYHIGSATTGSKYNSFKIILSARNNIYLIYKNMPSIQILFNMPFLFLGHFIKLIYFILKGYGKDYITGILQGFTNINKIKKNEFYIKNLYNYINIELNLIINAYRYMVYILGRDKG